MDHPGFPGVRRATPLGPASWLCALLLAADGAAEIVRINNRSLQIGVDRASNRVVEFVDGDSHQNFANPATGDDFWRLEFAGSPTETLSPTNARAWSVERRRGAEPGLRLTWSQFGLPDAPDLRVDVTVRLDRRLPLSRWQIALESPGGRVLERLRFPRILDLPRLERERLAMPFWGGLLAGNPRAAFATDSRGNVRREFDYPGHCSLQCMAFYSDAGPGLYVACDDPAGYRKLFAAFSTSDARPNRSEAAASRVGWPLDAGVAPELNFEVVHLPERHTTNANRYVLPYAAVLGTFRGDWFDAATMYRAWATNQVWARESRVRRGEIPSWITDTALWVWNRGRSPGVLDPAIALQQELGLPVSVFWHWWHGCAYDTGFPEYLPPREGDASFTAALEAAHEHDVRALVYMNQRLWGMTTASWTNEHAAAFAVKAADGEVKPEVYNTFTKRPCATMCLATEFWRAKYSNLATEAFNRLGVDGIYMDQACSSLSCFDPQHGHPPGGGTYWMNGFRALAADIRQRCSARGGVALAGEGCAENWLPYLDLLLALDVSRERYATPDGWDPIPFFHAVYHGYAIFYGSYSSLTMPPYDDLWPAEFAPAEPLQLLDRKFSTQFCLEQARAFIWGQQPTMANFQPSHLRERPEEIAYVIRLARLRRLALKYLQDGAMLPPPVVAVPRGELPISRLSIYAGQQGALKEFQKTVPLVFASAWRAPDGRAALAVANIADRPLTPIISLEAAKCGLSKRGRFRAIGEEATELRGDFDGKTLVLRPVLAPRDARVFEWTLD